MQTVWAFSRNVFKNSAIISIIFIVVVVVIKLTKIEFNFKSTMDNTINERM